LGIGAPNPIGYKFSFTYHVYLGGNLIERRGSKNDSNTQIENTYFSSTTT
jgi:hypothetical protein